MCTTTTFCTIQIAKFARLRQYMYLPAILFSVAIFAQPSPWDETKTWVNKIKRVWCLHFYWRPSIPPSKYCNVTFTETLLHKKKAVACPVYYTCIYVFIPLVIVPTVNVRVFENLAQQISSIEVFSKRRKLWASKIKEKLIANEAYDVITNKTIIAYWQKMSAYHFVFLLHTISDSSFCGSLFFCVDITRYIIEFITEITQMRIKSVLWVLRQNYYFDNIN